MAKRCLLLRRRDFIVICALVFAIYLSLRPPTCLIPEASPQSLSQSSRARAHISATLTASPSRGSSPTPTNSKAPVSTPAMLVCEQPLDVMAPTTRVSHAPYPSLVPAPSHASLDAAMEATRAAALRRHTAQCGTVVSDQLGNASARLMYCDDYSRAVQTGGRAYKDAPFVSNGCSSVWFTPSEACALLTALDKMILFVGDSLSRQLNQGVYLALTGS